MVTLPEWLVALLVLAGVARGALRDFVEHHPRFNGSLSEEADGSSDGSEKK